ncbi:hypothetical protein BDY21DRAFT_357979 [Lineolata rhizophorae]|uniref:Uncharacterized protein n=1 Tax=Lineolata rhizophorae TaxID=578093 RepID=A0A6A6NNF0_9PEZI|nr:hypothetical protein BDY21DRAFT_357979 [Lineolata rhizophorae]
MTVTATIITICFPTTASSSINPQFNHSKTPPPYSKTPQKGQTCPKIPLATHARVSKAAHPQINYRSFTHRLYQVAVRTSSPSHVHPPHLSSSIIAPVTSNEQK